MFETCSESNFVCRPKCSHRCVSLKESPLKPVLILTNAVEVARLIAVFEEVEQEREVLDANPLMTVSDQFRRSFLGANGDCCEQTARCMEVM